MICGCDEKLLESSIQEIIEVQNRDRIESSEIKPFEMEKNRETDLNLANIIIYKPDEQINLDMYNYLINKKQEELACERLVQLNKEKQENPNIYSIEKYLEEYQEQCGQGVTEVQEQGIRKFDSEIRTGLILGKYNLSDYITFLKAIPDLLSKKKAMGIGYYDGYGDGRFCIHGEVDEKLSAEKISKYSTYTYNTVKEMRLTNDEFKPMPASIKRRMSPEAEPLCAVDVEESQLFSPENQEMIKENPNTRLVGAGIMQRIYSDESGILFMGGPRVTVKEKSQKSSDDIKVKKTNAVLYTPQEIAEALTVSRDQIEKIKSELTRKTEKEETNKEFEEK